MRQRDDTTSPSREEIPHLFDLPDIYVRDIDWQSGEASCLRMSRETYAASSFLDHRALPADDRPLTLPIADLMRAYADQSPSPGPLRIIAHTALCGSTLLCRCLDLPGLCLPYKEPYLLHKLSGIWRLGLQDKLQASLPATEPSIMDLSLALTNRSYGAAEQAVIKLTDSCTSLLPTLLGRYPDSRILLMYSDLESFLVAMLRSPGRREFARNMLTRSRLDLTAVGMGRLVTDEDPGDGRCIALIWLSFMYPFLRLLASVPRRVRSLKSDVLFSSPLETVGSVDAFFDLGIGEDRLRSHLQAGVLSRDAKQRTVRFDIDQRRAEQKAAADGFRDEIDDALGWIVEVTTGVPIPGALPNPV